MFRFAHPMILHGLWCLPLLLVCWWWMEQQAKKRMRQFASSRQTAWLESSNSPGRRLAGWILILTAVTLVWIGMARPQTAVPQEAQKSRGLDIFFLVDTSRSMMAQDVKPSRLQRAQRSLFYLVDHLPTHRVGLVSFAGEAFISCPLTQDAAAFKLLVEALSTEALPTPGTNLAAALSLAVAAFQRTGARHQAVVIISDGEDFGVTPTAKIKQAAKNGVRLYCLGLGETQGATVVSRQGTKPKAVKSRLNEKLLKLVAAVGGGTYLHLTGNGQEEAELAEELNRLERIESHVQTYRIWKDQYAVLAALAAVLLLLELVLGRRRGGTWGHPREWMQRLRRMLLAGLAVGCLVSPVQAESRRALLLRGMEAFRQKDIQNAERLFHAARRSKPGDPLSEYNLGCVLLVQQKLETAYQAFERACPQAAGALLHNCWYNKGYTAFYLGLKLGEAEYWNTAVDAYQHCLLLDPQDDDARYNLELILREIERRTQPAASRQEQSQGQNSGRSDGSGADRLGPDRQPAQGQENDNAPPHEAQKTSSQRKEQSGKTRISEDQKGRQQQGMSPEDALRTLRSLEADERSWQQEWSQSSSEPEAYQGPDW